MCFNAIIGQHSSIPACAFAQYGPLQNPARFNGLICGEGCSREDCTETQAGLELH
ncbi:hypothetical protein DPMN_070279 [Dreissena polymorpha]|uniref:Uncharacterized protein n=1 Tax=Dreissena polymorpha TaxID=45954 RepID=A0A9D3Z2V9_DREPO|nr:hypothetical protein DPMN_070279 [Dreissena polymorpha]